MISHRNLTHFSPHHRLPACVSPPQKHLAIPAQCSLRKLSDASNKSQDEFDPVSFCDEKELEYYKRRSQFRKRGTPKVIILCGDTGRPKVFVQKLQTSLF